MHKDILKNLYEVFPLKTRQGTGGMTFKYVPNEDVINRMNTVFGGNWSTKIVDKDVADDQVVVEVKVEIFDPETKMLFSHSGFGSQQIMRYSNGPNAGKIIDIGNAYKGALAKGIVNACTRWGVGLFKEKNPYDSDNITLIADDDSPSVVPVMAPASAPPKTISPTAPPAGPIATQPVMPPATSAPLAAPKFDMPPQDVFTPPKAPTTAAPAPTFTPPAVENTTAMPAPPIVPNQPISTAVNITQEGLKMEMPKIPNPNAESARPVPQANATPPRAPQVPMASGNGLETVGISDVQKVALNGILSMHNVKYEDLAKEAFDNKGMTQAVPPKKDLTYEEAVVVIKYGNDKFRKNR